MTGGCSICRAEGQDEVWADPYPLNHPGTAYVTDGLYSGMDPGTYYYTVFPLDTSGNASEPKTASVTTPPQLGTTAPGISITTPVDGATYKRRSAINANYNCTDTVDSSPQCTGTVPTGSAIDTSTVGTKTFTVTAEDDAGNTTSVTNTYYVTNNGKPPSKGSGKGGGPKPK